MGLPKAKDRGGLGVQKVPCEHASLKHGRDYGGVFLGEDGNVLHHDDPRIVVGFTQSIERPSRSDRAPAGRACAYRCGVGATETQLLQPFQTYNTQQVGLRWNQYEQKAKENHAKAEINLMTLKPLIPTALYDELTALFVRLSAPFVWDLPHGKEKLKVLEDAMPEVLAARNKLVQLLEAKLGR